MCRVHAGQQWQLSVIGYGCLPPNIIVPTMLHLKIPFDSHFDFCVAFNMHHTVEHLPNVSRTLVRRLISLHANVLLVTPIIHACIRCHLNGVLMYSI